MFYQVHLHHLTALPIEMAKLCVTTLLRLQSCGEYDHSYDEVEQSRSHKLGSFCRHYMVNFQNKSLGFVTTINTVKSRKQAAHMSDLHAKPANPCPNHLLIYSSLRSPSTGTMCQINQ